MTRRSSRAATVARTAISQPERRQVTVLFCDLVDSTALSTRLDPEDLRDVLRAYQDSCEKALARHGGFISRYMGDGILVFFGYPVAHEDSACRAIRAGLEIVRVIPALRSPDGRSIGVRVSAATGVGVVGDLIGSGAAAEIAFTGKVINLAARILAAADPNTMVVAEETRQLAMLPFEFSDMGFKKFKGINEDVRVWQVISERVNHTKYDAFRVTRSFVGRAEELTILHRLWEDAGRANGHIAIVRGEAGIGKTALLRNFESEIKAPFTRILLQCTPENTDSPLYPLIAYLRRTSGITASESPESQLQKIEAITPSELGAQAVPLLAALLSVPSGKSYLALTMPPIQQKALTLGLISDYARLLADKNPVLLLLEDAHWMDPTSSELAELLARSLQKTRVLIIVSARPSYLPAWKEDASAYSINLAPLADADIRQIIHLSAAQAMLTAPVVDQIVARSEGVPLFAEELAKTMSEGVGPSSIPSDDVDRIPATLQDSLMARLDRLGLAKHLAQIAAVFGRRFTLRMLMAIGEESSKDLTSDLQQLVDSGLIVVRGSRSHREFNFKHALFREAAYDSLLRSKRRELHARIARMLESDFIEMLEIEPETVARHWIRGNEPALAAPLLLRAGQRSVSRAANIEAIRHLSEGIALLSKMPHSLERNTLDFQFHLGLGQACYVVDGPAAASTAVAYTRAQSLLELVGSGDHRYTVLYGIFSSYHFASRFDLAREPARRALELATKEEDDGHLCQAHRMLGYIDFFTGDTSGARKHFLTLVSLYDPEKHGGFAVRYGADCRIGALGFLALIECVSGHLTRALKISSDNLAYAKRLGHPASLGWAYASTGYLHFYLDEPESTRAITSEGIKYCDANRVGSWLAHCKAFHFWAQGRLSRDPEWAVRLRDTIAEAEKGNALGLPLLRTVLAELLLAQGEAEEALREVNVALDAIKSTSQYFFEPSLLLTLAGCQKAMVGLDTEAADSLSLAANAARRIGAIFLEQKANTALRSLRE